MEQLLIEMFKQGQYNELAEIINQHNVQLKILKIWNTSLSVLWALLLIYIIAMTIDRLWDHHKLKKRVKALEDKQDQADNEQNNYRN